MRGRLGLSHVDPHLASSYVVTTHVQFLFIFSN